MKTRGYKMPKSLDPFTKKNTLSFNKLFEPLIGTMVDMPPLESRGNRSLKMTFEDQLKALVFYHLEEHKSGRHLLQVLEEDDFARETIAPKDGIKKSSFYEANNTRGLEQLNHVFINLQKHASAVLPKQYQELGDLVSIDGSLIDGVFSMYWADYRKGSKKAKVHLGLDLNRGIPRKIFLTEGKGAERPFVSKIIEPGQTSVMDRGYQCHECFDQWQKDGKHFVCRIKAGTTKTILVENPIDPQSIVFYDAVVLLGSQYINQTKEPVRLVGYEVAGVKYWVATSRFDLSAEQIAFIYKLRWDVEKFFAWWKRHLKVYHLIARSKHGLMVQILAGLITYLLLAIYCHEQFNEKVSIKRVRQLRNQILNETRQNMRNGPEHHQNKDSYFYQSYAKT
jgi:hypothetical protein